MRAIFYSLALLAVGFLVQGCATSHHPPAAANAEEARAYFEVLRSDFNTSKIRALNQAMKLTVPEANLFWPIYRGYEHDLGAVSDRKLTLISKFMTHHQDGTLTDENSKAMAEQWLQNAQDRLNLWKQYHQKISAALSPVRAAQFLQVENQMAIFVDLNIASTMPMVAASPESGHK